MCRINHHAQGAGAHGTGKLRQCSRISITKRLSFRRVRLRWGNHLQACCQSAFHGRLKRSLLRVRNLSPVTCEHLQAVVFDGVVRCGHNHAACGTRFTGYECGEPWRWNHANIDDGAAVCLNCAGKRSRKRWPARSSVASDEH
jgi:hypothetical protein